VGAQLPDVARNLVARTLRLNQVTAVQASNYLISQGAEQQQLVTSTTITVVGEGAAAQRIQNTQTTVQQLAPQQTASGGAQGATGQTGALVLRGLLVAADQRLNTVTLVGEPRKVEIATAFLNQLDLRRRQVAINVKIVDVNLSGLDAFNASFSFGIGNAFFTSDAARGLSVNYGGFRPANSTDLSINGVTPPVIGNPITTGQVFLDPNNRITIPGGGGGIIDVDGNFTPTDATFLAPTAAVGRGGDPTAPGILTFTQGTPTVRTSNPDGSITVTQGTPSTITTGLPTLFQFPKRLLAALQAQIQSNNAKILTDPTLVVQEGQTAQVNLTQEVVGNITSETQSSGNETTRTVTAQIREAGLILAISVDRIDDNGFINLAVNPRVTSIGNLQDLSTGSDTNRIALLNVRQLASGQIRLRDGQTLILSGIIQEIDRATVRKVPILGDIPLLGALFRSTERQNQRQEVIVLLTPQIIDDSEGSSFGYNYTPGREARQIMQRGNPSGGNQ
jgi:type IV pilus assembly protein PilQ